MAGGANDVYNLADGADTTTATTSDGSNWKAAGIAALGGLFGLTAGGGDDPKPTGYQGGIPEFTGVRDAVPNTFDPNRRAGSGGQRYFTDMQFAEGADELAAAQGIAAAQIPQLQAMNAGNPASDYNSVGAATALRDQYTQSDGSVRVPEAATDPYADVDWEAILNYQANMAAGLGTDTTGTDTTGTDTTGTDT